MNTKEIRKKMKRFTRFTVSGALMMAIIGLILTSPLSASGQGARHGNEYRGAEEHIEFFKIVLDLSDGQVEKLGPIMEEHREKIAEIHEDAGMPGHRAMRMKRVHRYDCCDKVDRTEMRTKMRRQRRELKKDRESIRKRIEMHREEMDEKLANILDDEQMKKYRELRDLREKRRDGRKDRYERRQSAHGGVL